MVSVVNIEAILRKQTQIAFLSSESREGAIAQTLVALANSKGGTVIIGFGKNGKPRKFSDPEASRDRLMNAALQCDPPLIIPAPTLSTYKKHPILIANIPPDLPHVYNIEGRYLIWEEEQATPLSASALRQLIFARGEASFEGTSVPESSLADLNWRVVEAYTHSVEGLRHLSPEEALLKRGCLKVEGDKMVPTKAGLLLFAQSPQQWLPQAEITVARYSGTQMADAFIRADIQGTLPEQARQAEAFILENISRGVQLNALQRHEAYLYPLNAIREIIINALAHRDYSIKGDNIRLLLFANRLECYSPGRLPGHITVDNILQERFSRNAAIVQVLFDMGFIERLGYGIDRIVDSLKEHNLPQPDFEETVAGFKITLHSPPQLPHLQNQPSIREWLEMGLNNRQITALTYLSEKGRISNADYQSLCPDVSPETLRRDLADLVNRNILLRIGEKRATFYILK